MIITLDNLASRYHCLPSLVLERATTFDLRVCEVATQWSNRQHDPKLQTSAKIKPSHTVDELKAMIERVKNK